MVASVQRYAAWGGAAVLHVLFFIVFGVLYFHLEHLYRVAEIRSAAEQVKVALVQAESGQRGFLLTGNERYVDNYRYDSRVLRTRINYLCRLIPATVQNRNDCHRLSELATMKLQEMNDTLTLARSGKIGEALRIVRTDRGYEYTGEIGVLLDSIRTENATKGIDAGCLVGK